MISIRISADELQTMQGLLSAASLELQGSTHPLDQEKRAQMMNLFARFSILLSRKASKGVGHG